MILSTEIQIEAVHYLIYFKDFSCVDEVRNILKNTRLDGKGFGRPWIKIPVDKFYSKIEDFGILGPAHGFTPYFGLLGPAIATSFVYFLSLVNYSIYFRFFCKL